ncbi:MAG: HlyC/CorC family transporter [Burkholderiales bacterium]|nr:HlyC/CorC family transporter [Burkholderiales bacterium]
MEIVIVLALIALNGVFAMSEMAIVSARKARLQQLADEGRARAKVALDLANEPGNFLSTVQIGITLIGILSGAFGGALFSQQLAVYVARVPALAEHSEAIALTIVVAVITYFSLILGELAPKRLALLNPELIASLVARPMRMLSKIASPLVSFLSVSTSLVLRVIGAKASTEPPVTQEEIHVLIEQGAEAGVFERAEQDLVRNIFRLDELRVGAIMVPRLDVVFLDLEDSVDRISENIIGSVHSRFPVCKGGVDTVLGVVHSKDLLAASLAGKPLDLAAALRPPLYVPDSVSAMELLEMFKKTRTHIALIVDEYGDLQGLVTLNDVMEAIIGDIPSGDLPEESLAVQREDGSWLLDGMLSIEKLKELFDLDKLPYEESGNYHTVGGFVMMRLGRVPKKADYTDWSGWRFEVVDMDKNRVDQVLVASLKTVGL